MEIKAKEIISVDIDSLIPNPKNNNKHPKEQIERLSKLIKYQGFRNPLVVSNRSGFVLCGHGRIEAAKLAGMKKVPVMYQDFENEAQEYAYLTSDNAIASWAELDLSAVNTEMLDLGPDFDIEMLAIKDFVIEPIEKFEPQSDEDEIPEVVHPITRRGDIWLLGNHRLMCGDSTMIDDVEKLMNGEKADMVFTDPPYNQSANGGSCFDDRESRKKLIESKNLNNFDPNGFFSILEILRPETIYAFTSKDLIKDFIANFEQKNWTLLTMVKRNPIPQKNNKFLTDTEYLFCIREKGAFWRNDLRYDYYRRFQQVNVRPSRFGHPTEKQVEYCEKYFELSSKKGALVIDLFSGSGTTLIVSEKLGRKFFGMELDEKYCDVIIKRWEQYTGKKAVLESTNQTYEELKLERGK